MPVNFLRPHFRRAIAIASALMLTLAAAARGQETGAPLPAPPAPPAAAYPPQELDRIVSPIALYPDPLLAQVLTAATFSPEIPDAARWADAHHYFAPPALANAIAEDQLAWQPSVQALLPFPSVLDMMATDMPWTNEIGAAFLAQPGDVMDAVQRQRQIAWNYGYLRPNGQILVNHGPTIEILPVNPAFIPVPVYSPAVVFAAPRPGFVVTHAISVGFGVTIGTAFAPWGWGTTHFVWGTHVLVVNNAPWRRTWANRLTYVHPFAAVPQRVAPRGAVVPERHAVIERSPQERQAAREGHPVKEEHHEKDHRR